MPAVMFTGPGVEPVTNATIVNEIVVTGLMIVETSLMKQTADLVSIILPDT